jgi:hypothetical protein
MIPVYNSAYLPCLMQNDSAVGSLSVLIRKGSQGLLLHLCCTELRKCESYVSCTEIARRKYIETGKTVI